jgi:hypothetical protein
MRVLVLKGGVSFPLRSIFLFPRFRGTTVHIIFFPNMKPNNNHTPDITDCVFMSLVHCVLTRHAGHDVTGLYQLELNTVTDRKKISLLRSFLSQYS